MIVVCDDDLLQAVGHTDVMVIAISSVDMIDILHGNYMYAVLIWNIYSYVDWPFEIHHLG